MRILHVVTTLDVGGAEMHLLEQARGQAARGHAVRMAYLKGEGTLAPDFLEAGVEEVVRAPLGPALPARLWGHLRWAEIVHSHLLKADAVTALLATLAGRRARLVSGKHNDERALLNPWVSRVHGLLGNLPARTIALSDHVGRFVEQHGRVRRAKLRRVYYGLDPRAFEAAGRDLEQQRATREALGIGADELVFVCVARFAPQKAHDVLLRAFRRALDEYGDAGPRLRLLLVGGDPFGDGLERSQALARELDLGERVLFAGIRRDVPALLGASDVFVMSSLWEGLGLVFLEAMAAGIPVLATRVSAVPEVVVDGETGVLVEPADEQDLARGFLLLARDGELRARLAQAGRARVAAEFGLDRMVDETLAIYRELLDGR